MVGGFTGGAGGRINVVANWAEGFRSRHSLCLPCLSAMAPHLSPEELDLVAGYVAKRLTAKEIWTQQKLHRDNASIDRAFAFVHRRYSRLMARTSSGTEHHSPTTGAGECQACVDCEEKRHA